MSPHAARLLMGTLGSKDKRVIVADGSIGDLALASQVRALAERLHQARVHCVASRMDNGLRWLVLDLAVRMIDGVHVPLPTFFSEEQTVHALRTSGAQAVVVADGTQLPPGVMSLARALAGTGLGGWRLEPEGEITLPADTACITYTSGTTGRPKGVCLDAASLLTVAGSLVQASSTIGPRRHLCLMPLSTLLENVAGLYATLLADAQIALPSLAEIGYTGAAGLDAPTLLRCLHRYQPESVILVPQLLLALVAAAEQGAPATGHIARNEAVGVAMGTQPAAEDQIGITEPVQQKVQFSLFANPRQASARFLKMANRSLWVNLSSPRHKLLKRHPGRNTPPADRPRSG